METVDAFLAAEGPDTASTRAVRWAQARSDTNQAEMADFNVLFLGYAYLWDGFSLDRWAQSRLPDPDGIYPLLSTTNNAWGLLQRRLDVLVAQLKQLNDGKDPTESVTQPTVQGTAPGNLTLFTEDVILELIGSFFCRRHWQWPIIHWPTFDTEKVALPLLLAAALTGAASSHPDDYAARYRLSARACLKTAEKYIFAALEDIGDTTTASSGDSDEVIQICQAALLISALQTSIHDEETRRRVIMNRHPSLISALRRFGLMCTKHVPETQKSWSDFIRHESIIRLVTWTFLADSILPAFSNLPPCMTVSEMIGDLPSDDTIWNAATEAEFEDKWSSYMLMQRPPSLKQVIQGLLDEEGENYSKGSYESLDIHLLYLVLWAFQPVIFNLRATLISSSGFSAVTRALDRWKCLWDGAVAQLSASENMAGSTTNHAPELIRLTEKIVEVASRPGADEESRYLRTIPSYGTTEIHEFIKQYFSQA